jgi:RNA polymerase sigma-70 factor (ECF subfamily)
VIDALRDLSPGQRNCLVLRYYMELSNPEIARTLGVSVNTVKTQIQRGMASLERTVEGGT